MLNLLLTYVLPTLPLSLAFKLVWELTASKFLLLAGKPGVTERYLEEVWVL